MSSMNPRNSSERQPLNEKGQRYVNHYAPQLAKLADLSDEDSWVEKVRKLLIQDDPALETTGEDIFYAKEAYEEALRIKETAIKKEAEDLKAEDEAVKKEIEELEKKQNILNNRIADEQKSAQDKFARLMPRATVNPEIWEDIKDVNVRRVWSGTKHKLGRAYDLRAPYRLLAPGEFTLKTKKEKKGAGDSTDVIAEHIGSKQSEVEHGELAKSELHEEILRVTKIFDDLKTERPIVNGDMLKLKDVLGDIANGSKDVAFMIAEYMRMARLMSIEEDQAKGNLIDRGVGKLYQGYRSVIWADKNHAAYREAFENQTAIEAKIIEFETGLKYALRVLGGSGNMNVEGNANASETYSADSTNLREFERRQEHLLRRIKLVEGLLKDLNGGTEDLMKATDQDIYAAKMHKLGYEADIRDIDKIATKWSKQNIP
ncbi:MAG TPA: hypothetical protein VGO21_04245, partial [Candidatus Paceibacterota bacterium]|nr:hypothetical protein [Candidatus Paceibacterota bacterium]